MPLVPNIFAGGAAKIILAICGPGPTEKLCSDGTALDHYLTFGTRQKSSDRLAHQGGLDRSVVDGRQGTNCSAALSTTHRKRAEQRFHQTGNQVAVGSMPWPAPHSIPPLTFDQIRRHRRSFKTGGYSRCEAFSASSSDASR